MKNLAILSHELYADESTDSGGILDKIRVDLKGYGKVLWAEYKNRMRKKFLTTDYQMTFCQAFIWTHSMPFIEIISYLSTGRFIFPSKEYLVPVGFTLATFLYEKISLASRKGKIYNHSQF